MIGNIENKKFKNHMRAQSAIEYLTTYGWVLLAVILALTLLYVFTLSQATYPPGSCSFSIGFYCKDIVIGTNSITQQTKAGILLVNQQPYGMLNPAIYTSINGQNSTLQKCNPSYAAPGGSIICVIDVPKNFTIGQLVAGGLYMKANYCGLSSNPGNISMCSSTPYQTYTGTFNTHTSVFQGNNEFLIIVKPNSPVWPVGDPCDGTYATVYFYGVPLAGATVQFSTQSTNAYINPPYATTVFGTGIATTYTCGAKKGPSIIYATFGPVSNNTQITFYNSTNSGTTIPTTSSTTTSSTTSTSTSTSTSTTSTSTSTTSTSTSTSTSTTSTTSTSTSTSTTTTTTTTISATTTIPPAGNVTVTGPTSCPPGTVASGIEDAVSTFIGVGSGGSAVAYGSGYFSYSLVGTADGTAFSGVTSLSPNPISPLNTGSNVILNTSTSNQTANISKSFNGTNSSSLNKSLNKLTTELSQLKINNVVGTLSVQSNGTAYVYPSTLPISQSSYASEDTLVSQPYFCGTSGGLPQYCQGQGGVTGYECDNSGTCSGYAVGALSVCAPGGNTPQNNCTGFNFPGYPVTPFVSSQATTCVASIISPTNPNTTVSGSIIYNPAFPVGYPCFMMNTYTQSNTGAAGGSISSYTTLTGTNNSVPYTANLQKYFVDQVADGSPQATLNNFFSSYSDGATAQACSGITGNIGAGLDGPPSGCMSVVLTTSGSSSSVSFSCPSNNNGVTSFCPPSYNVNLDAECYSPLTNNVTASTNTTCPIGTRKISTYMQIGPYSSYVNNNGFNVAGFYQFYQAPTSYWPGPPSQDNGNYSSTQSMVDYGAYLGMGLQQPSAGSGPTNIMYVPYKQISNNGIISSVAYYPTGETNATCTLGSPCGAEYVNGKKSGNIVSSGPGNIGIINVECTAIGTGSSSIKQINGFVPIKLKYKSKVAHSGPFQYPISIDSAMYKQYINGNWNNVEFTLNNTAESINVTPIYAWIESNATNSSTDTIVFLNLSKGMPANSNVSVYMNFMTYNVMTNVSSYTGEAPQLSPTYGEYDNGKKIFYYYNNFKNATDLSGTSTSYSFTYANAISNDGLTVNYEGYADYLTALNPGITPANNVTVDVSANMPAPTSTQFDEVGVTPFSNPMSLYAYGGYANAGWVTSSRLGSSNAYPLFSNTSTLYIVNTTTLAPLGQNIYSVGFSNINASNGTMYFSYNYGLQTQMRKYNYQYPVGSEAIGMFNNQTGGVMHANWVDTRAFIPPGSISSSIGPINTPT